MWFGTNKIKGSKMKEFLEMLKDGTLSNVLSSFGKVASVFNPAIGGGLMLASNITDNIADVDDYFLENKVIGLQGTALRIDKMVESGQVDFDALKMLSDNLKSMSVFAQKTAKLIA